MQVRRPLIWCINGRMGGFSDMAGLPVQDKSKWSFIPKLSGWTPGIGLDCFPRCLTTDQVAQRHQLPNIDFKQNEPRTLGDSPRKRRSARILSEPSSSSGQDTMTISSFRTPQNTKLPLQIDARHRCVDSCSIQYRSFADGLPSQTRVLTKIIMDRTSKAFGRDPCYSAGETTKWAHGPRPS